MLTKILQNKLYNSFLGRMILDGIAGIQFLMQGKKFKHFGYPQSTWGI
jgi:hypothetical protein